MKLQAMTETPDSAACSPRKPLPWSAAARHAVQVTPSSTARCQAALEGGLNGNTDKA